jgi:hypothetical protein
VISDVELQTCSLAHGYRLLGDTLLVEHWFVAHRWEPYGKGELIAESEHWFEPRTLLTRADKQAVEIHRRMVAKLLSKGWQQRERGAQWYNDVFCRPDQG